LYLDKSILLHIFVIPLTNSGGYDMNFSHLANKLRSKIAKFSGILSIELDKTAGRFIKEAVYGIIASQSVMLTEIGRQLESKVKLKKIEERFSRQLNKPQIWESVHQQILSLARSRINKDTLLILDLSDIHKPYAEKMEYLAKVRDGSSLQGNIVDGYWTNQVIAAELGSNELTPLYSSLYSQESPDFKSENEEINGAIDFVSKQTGNQGVWVIDRGGDRDKIYEPLIKNKRQFIIRLVGERNLICRGKSIRALWLAYACPCSYKETIVRVKNGEESVYQISYGAISVRLPWSNTPLTLVVVKGYGKKPMMLLTSLQVKRSKGGIKRIIQSYIKRWSIEETIRFIKQTYDLENIRVLKYRRLQNMMALLLAVFYFIAVILDHSNKLTIMTGHILKSAKRVFGIPDFKYYALGDGISNIFKRCPGKLSDFCRNKADPQLNFIFC